jgi:hypothetical protein
MTTDMNLVILSLNLDMQQAATAHFVPCSLTKRVPAWPDTSLCRIMYATRGPVELPAAGSSAIPYSGANIRE